MFSKEISKLTNENLTARLKLNEKTQDYSHLNIEYEICSRFLKQTGEKLYQKQSALMLETSRFLDRREIGSKLAFSRSRTTTAAETQSIRSFLSDNQTLMDSQAQPESECASLRRCFSRKSIGIHSRKKIDDDLSEALQEVALKCSADTHQVLSTAINEFTKNKKKAKVLEVREKIMEQKLEKSSQYHQENLILLNQINVQRQEIKSLKEQVSKTESKSREEMDAVMKKVQSLKINQKYVEINNKVYREIKKYLADKETHLECKAQKIESIQTAFLIRIESVLHQSGQRNCDQRTETCVKCCDLLKKMKSSIMNYREYLQGQIHEMQKLYEKYKKSLFIQGKP